VDLIHRDLKGKNLLVDKAWNVKVCDFGLSRFIEGIFTLEQIFVVDFSHSLGVNKNNQYSLTSCGTPVYAAPEVPFAFITIFFILDVLIVILFAACRCFRMLFSFF
jgi:serine/threonine protein kinase